MQVSVEVFKTNVQTSEQSERMVMLLAELFPARRITFDLEDCDKILRIAGEDICIESAVRLLSDNGYLCEVLE